MTTTTRVTSPADLRLMPFGRTQARQVRDGLWEPLWGGQRTLVEVLGDRVTFRDEHNQKLDGYDPLRAAILDAAQADELVLDGYLLPAPLRDSAGIEAPPGMDSLMSVGGVGRQFLLGGGRRREHRDAIVAATARRAQIPSASPTALVAVDLLWMDGESIIDVPLQERKRLLESVLLEGEIVRRTVAVRPPVEQWFAQWRVLGFRELAVKGANSRYTPGRPNDEWATAFIPKR
ncbi:MAG: hypothetical protein C0498_08110 [Anaerolinea sp.]|nr:hypothetical protein [Anaerolinea sp.]